MFIYKYCYKTAQVKVTLLDTITPPPPATTNYISLFNGIRNVENGNLFNFVGKNSTSIFEIRDIVIAKATIDDRYNSNSYYLFPFLYISNYFETQNSTFLLKRKINGKLNNTKINTNEQIETQMLVDVLNNFNSYLSDLNGFFDMYFKQANAPCKNGSLLGDCIDIFTGYQCRYVIYFCLLLFNFKCKIKNVENISHIFQREQKPRLIVSDVLISPTLLHDSSARARHGKRAIADMNFYYSDDIFVKIENPQPVPILDIDDVDLNTHGINPRRKTDGIKITDNRPDNVPHQVAADQIAELYSNHPPPSLNVDYPNDINVIGIFTDTADDSNESLQFDFTKIKGLYYIQSEDFLSVYNEIKAGLNSFFEKFNYHFDDPDKLYSDIVIL